MNTANKITIFRLMLIPVFLCLLLNEMYEFSLFVFLIASITDHLDGKVARKQGTVTDFGKFLDPLADKALVMSAFICFVELKKVSSVAVILMLIREFMVMSIRLIAAKDGEVISANIWGKAKTVSQLFSIFLVIIVLILSGGRHAVDLWQLKALNIVKEILIWGSVVLSWLSGVIYIYKNRKAIKEI